MSLPVTGAMTRNFGVSKVSYFRRDFSEGIFQKRFFAIAEEISERFDRFPRDFTITEESSLFRRD